MKLKGLLLSTVAAALSFVPLSAAAQVDGAAEAGSVGEIVVTARKRNETLVDVPIAVSVVNGASLEAYASGSVSDVARLAPNLYVDRVPAGPRISMRGLGNAQSGGVLDSSVGLGIDGIFYGRPRWLAVGMFDVDSVEVLRGPQSTYYGKNTTAGLVNIRTRGPTSELSGYARVANEFEIGGQVYEAAISGPIAENFDARLALHYSDSDGYIDLNEPGAAEPRIEDFIGRLSLAWTPAPNLNLSYRFTSFDSDTRGNAQEYGVCSPEFRTLLSDAGSAEDCTINFRRTPGGTIAGGRDQSPEGTTSDGQSHVLGVNWDVGGYNISSVTGYQEMNASWHADGDWIDVLPFFNVHRPESYDQLSEEIRVTSPDFGPFSYVVGAYYDDASKRINQNLDVPGFSSIKPLSIDATSWAIFGEATVRLSDSLTLLAGGRYTEEEQDGRIMETQGFPSPITTVAYDVSESRTTDDFSPSLTLQWQALDDAMLYASYTEGFKSGGYDLDLADPTDIDPATGKVRGWEFGDENAESYEVGFKGEFFDRTLLVTAAAFETRFSDMQVQAYNGSSISAVTVNAAEATSRGVELEALWTPDQHWTVRGSIAHVDAEYDSFPKAPCYQGQTVGEGCFLQDPGDVVATQNLGGARLSLAPETTASLGVDWRRAAFAGHDLELGADVSYRSEVFLTLEQDPLATQDSVTLVNARAALTPQSGRGWSAALIARNLFDEAYTTGAVSLFGVPDTYVFNVAPPRTVELRVGYEF